MLSSWIVAPVANVRKLNWTLSAWWMPTRSYSPQLLPAVVSHMAFNIAFYIHHHGSGHLMRSLSIAAHLDDCKITFLGSDLDRYRSIIPEHVQLIRTIGLRSGMLQDYIMHLYLLRDRPYVLPCSVIFLRRTRSFYLLWTYL
jgi:hypothetical protein